MLVMRLDSYLMNPYSIAMGVNPIAPCNVSKISGKVGKGYSDEIVIAFSSG